VHASCGGAIEVQEQAAGDERLLNENLAPGGLLETSAELDHLPALVVVWSDVS